MEQFVRVRPSLRQAVTVGLWLFTVCLGWAGGTVIASSKLERCVKDGAVETASLACNDKLVVTVAVEGGRELDTERLEFEMGCVGSPECPCPCNYASDRTCSCRDLGQKLSINLQKTPVSAAYPLTYVQSFNAKPTEVTHAGLTNCQDGEYQDNPTCGWYYDEGQKVPESQGFCCECRSGQVLQDTFGNLEERTRGNLNCDFFSNTWNPFGSPPASAHCLYLDPLWYEGFELGSAQTQFEITVKVEKIAGVGPPAEASAGSETSPDIDTESLVLSPSEPHKMSENRTVEAELLGDLASYTEFPSLSNKLLMVPFPDGSDLNEALTSNKDEWMFIDRSDISMDGGECDRVGTSFAAFRYQAGGCDRPVGACLAGQLKDKFEEDARRVEEGLTPQYLISRYVGSQAQGQIGRGSSGSGPLSFQFPVTQIRNSIVTLSVTADSLRLVIHASPGEILRAMVCVFANVTCGGFEALTDRGYLGVEIKNTGFIDSDYKVTVSNCSSGVMPIQAQSASLRAGETLQLPSFQVFMTTDNAREELYCWVNLLDSLGDVRDTREVQFYVNATQYANKPNNPDFKNGTGPGPEYRKLRCSDFCPNLINIPCFVVKRCWSRLLTLFGIVLGVILGASLCWASIRRGWCVKLIGCWCSMLEPPDKRSRIKGHSYGPPPSRRPGPIRHSVVAEMMLRMMRAEAALASGGSRAVDTPTVHPGCKTLVARPRSEGAQQLLGALAPNSHEHPVQAAVGASMSDRHSEGHGEDLEARVRRLASDCRSNGAVFVNGSLLGSPSWLLNPGPAYCVAGRIQMIENIPGTPPSVVFMIPPERLSQQATFNPSTQTYERLAAPIPIDASAVATVLDADAASRLLTPAMCGHCLN